MKKRVVKQKSNIGTKTNDYFHNTQKNKKEEEENKENVLEDGASGDDNDLVLEECDVKDDYESESEEIAEEDEHHMKVTCIMS